MIRYQADPEVDYYIYIEKNSSKECITPNINIAISRADLDHPVYQMKNGNKMEISINP